MIAPVPIEDSIVGPYAATAIGRKLVTWGVLLTPAL